MTICFALWGSKNDVVWNIVWVASCQVEGLTTPCAEATPKIFSTESSMCWAKLGFLSEKWQDEQMKRPFSLKTCIKTVTSCITGPWNSALSPAICAIFGDRSHFARRCSKVLFFSAQHLRQTWYNRAQAACGDWKFDNISPAAKLLTPSLAGSKLFALAMYDYVDFFAV